MILTITEVSNCNCKLNWTFDTIAKVCAFAHRFNVVTVLISNCRVEIRNKTDATVQA